MTKSHETSKSHAGQCGNSSINAAIDECINAMRSEKSTKFWLVNYGIQGENCIEIMLNNPKNLHESVHTIVGKSQSKVDTLLDICAVDFINEYAHFEVVYHFLSMRNNLRIRLKTKLKDGESIDSLCGFFKSANWLERETFDMFGIKFNGHPNLKRILTEEGFSGFPLRKSFPLWGETQVRYDENEQKVIHEPVKLKQEYRDFSDTNMWQGYANKSDNVSQTKNN